MIDSAIGIVRSVAPAARSPSETSRRTRATTISVEWSGRADPGGAVRVGVVGGARSRRRRA